MFHTIFNVLGVLVLTPFISRLVTFLNKLFVITDERRWRPRFLDEEVTKTPGPAIAALYKEAEHLFDGISELIIQALRLHQHEVFSDFDIDKALQTVKTEEVDIDTIYEKRIKFLYSDILKYSILAEQNMDKEMRRKSYKIKLASRDMIEAIKDIRELQKNIAFYMEKNNEHIKHEYNFLRKDIAELLRIIALLRKNPGELEKVTALETAKEQNKGLDIVAAKRLSILLREGKINETMASSLLNDGTYTSQIAEKLLKSADILWGTNESGQPLLNDSLLQIKSPVPLIQ